MATSVAGAPRSLEARRLIMNLMAFFPGSDGQTRVAKRIGVHPNVVNHWTRAINGMTQENELKVRLAIVQLKKERDLKLKDLREKDLREQSRKPAVLKEPTRSALKAVPDLDADFDQEKAQTVFDLVEELHPKERFWLATRILCELQSKDTIK